MEEWDIPFFFQALQFCIDKIAIEVILMNTDNSVLFTCSL